MSNTKGDFKKGDKRINRRGAPKLDPIIKQIREIERTELTLEFSKMLRMIKPQLQELIQNPQTCIKDLGIAKAILEWLKSGNFSYIQPYIEYIFGKPKVSIEHSMDEPLRIEYVSHKTNRNNRNIPEDTGK